MKTIKLEQGTPEWEEFRRMKIGASDSPAICEVSPYKTPKKLWEEKIKGITGFNSIYMQRGKELEPQIRDAIEIAHQKLYQPIVIQHDKHEWMIASLDGYDEKSGTIIEIKTTSSNKLLEIRFSNQIPVHYRYQMQHQMEVAGVDSCILAVSDGIDTIEMVEKKYSPIINEIIKKGEDFYHSIMTFSPPKKS